MATNDRDLSIEIIEKILVTERGPLAAAVHNLLRLHKALRLRVESMEEGGRLLRLRVEYLETAVKDILGGLMNFEQVNGIRQYASETAASLDENIDAYNREVLRSAGLPTTR